MPTFVNDTQTTIKNTSGKTMRFGFTPYHGAQLTANQVVTVDGDISDYYPRPTQKRWRQSVANANTLGIASVSRNIRQLFIGRVSNAAAVSTINAGDMVWWDPTVDSNVGSIRSAVDTPAGGTLVATRTAFAQKFIGRAVASHTSQSAVVTNFVVDMSATTIFTVACQSETHNIGDAMGLVGNAGTFLITSASTFIKGVTAPESIAVCQSYDPTAVTTTSVRLVSPYSA